MKPIKVSKTIPELPVVPIDDNDSICFTGRQISRQISSESGPEKWRYSSGWRKMILIDVIQNFIIQRYEILNFRLSDSILSTSDIS